MKWTLNEFDETSHISVPVLPTPAKQFNAKAPKSITESRFTFIETGKTSTSNRNCILLGNFLSRISLICVLPFYLGLNTVSAAEDFPPFLQSDRGLVAAEAEHFHANTPQGKHKWIVKNNPKKQGYSGEAVVRASPGDETNITSDYDALSPRLDYEVEFTTAGTQYVWVRGFGRSDNSNSIHIGLNGQMLSSGANILIPIAGDYEWNDGLISTIDINAPGVHTVNLWMHKSGTVVDKLVLSSDAGYVPSGTGPGESSAGDGQPPPVDQGDNPQRLISIEAEHYHAKLAKNRHNWIPAEKLGSSGKSAMMASPEDRVKINSGYKNSSPQIDYQIKFTIPGTYYVWLRAYGPNRGSNSLHLGLDGKPVKAGKNISVSMTGDYTWTDGMKTPIEISETGLHTLNLWMRESGTVIDKIVLSTDPGYAPTDQGPKENAVDDRGGPSDDGLSEEESGSDESTGGVSTPDDEETTTDGETPTDTDGSDSAGDDGQETNEDTEPGLGYRDITLKRSITGVQPMTGIVLWENSWNSDSIKQNPGNIQLEYAYVKPSSIVTNRDQYDWSSFDNFLDRIASRKHQAVVRFYYVYPGQKTAVPEYIKEISDYKETSGSTEGKKTFFPDWTHEELKRFHLEFYSNFAARYDTDPRIAFLQTGFGLWSEYHIYDGPKTIGKQFPDKDFQETFIRHLESKLKTTHWGISIDAGDDYYTPFEAEPKLLRTRFGMFDDSFMHKEHDKYNKSMWEFFSHHTRYEHSPHGGELSYYTSSDQKHALDKQGMHGRTYEQLSAKYHISYMIGNDQPNYQSTARIREAGMANGYRFEVVSFRASTNHSLVKVRNIGIAPIYYDAFVTIDGVRANESLKGLLPGDTREYAVYAGGTSPGLTIECDRLVQGQKIEFEADL